PMQESQQNAARHAMYLNQLDFEKIYSLGNWPGITPLLQKHNIAIVTGVTGTSYSVFASNPFLVETTWADNIQLFNVKPGKNSGQGDLPLDTAAWLLKPSTLANDIGDDEDTQDFLPASLATTRLSKPNHHNGQTYRLTTSPIILLDFNMADYSAALWDQDGDGKTDTTSELFVKLAFPAKNLAVGSTPLQSTLNTIRLSPSEMAINNKGHIVITLNNPMQEPVAIDMIALGVARVP
ncbi:MAG: hypothetical protein HYZ63_00275, partial [Candidatus Andersenbacteria bacterium]|nr:hypothetical protein [Candidatus Andersenbacteria bacterium]